ncbi:putative isomerase YbhE [Delitschia confertaspora ATCC 74209]|uniref:Isomerase YbhE n=1 Tax=Delitschia confertaspora ATCC 74209 TaxID=1513339 RepID=A0A9P4JRC5_9PLEO|nr:putative isomerase YbhE [Delitschia confertaspora ATCC 74209]
MLLTGLSLLSETFAVKLLASHFSGQVYTLDLTLTNPTTGALKISSQQKGCGVTPTWLYLDEESRTVYCFDESWAGSGVIQQYSLNAKDASTTQLKLTGSASTAGNSVYGSLYGGPNGKSFVITAEYTPSTLTTYKLPITSSTKQLQKLSFTMAKPGPRPDRQDKPHPHAGFTDPTGKFMIVPDLGADLTRIFKINADTGMLTACGTAASLAGDGPRHGVFYKIGDGYKYYSLNEVSSSVGVYDVKFPASGSSDCLSLSLTNTHSTYGPGVALGNKDVKSAEIRIAGNFLYASNRNDKKFGSEQDSIATFKIESSGALTFIELANSYTYYPRSFTINKNGTYMAVGGQTTANVAIIARDTETGKLGKLVANLALPPRGTYGGEDGLSSVIWDE